MNEFALQGKREFPIGDDERAAQLGVVQDLAVAMAQPRFTLKYLT